MNDIRLMMTGAGAPGAPGIIECYRKNGERDISVLGVDAREFIATRNLLDGFEQIPPASSRDFIDSVLNIAIENKTDVIQPLVTRELELFSAAKERFASHGIAVCVSPLENLEIANDKGLLLQYLKKAGIEVPDHVKTDDVEEFKKACASLGYPEKPVCFKPTRANGSRGFRIIDNSIDRSRILFEQKPTSIYMDYDTAVSTLSDMDRIPELLVMEFMPGEEYSVDMLFDNGEPVYGVVRLRNTMTGGISTDCTVVDEEDVREYACRVGKALKLHGNIGIQLRRDVNGKAKILEINPRVQGSIVCCGAAGVNLPYFGIKLALGEELPSVDVRYGVRMIRYWEECYYDNEGRPFTY